MLYNTMHHRWMRIVAAIFGEVLISLSGRLLIVPMGLYAGGLMGTCQLLRTFLQNAMGLSLGTYDIAGILYFLTNIPILLLAYRGLGKSLAAKTVVCTVAYSVIYSLIPSPATPIIDDYLTCCLLGALGVSKEDIAADYCLSQVYLQEMFEAMRSGALTLQAAPRHFEEYVFQTPFTAMMKFYDFFVEEFGSVRNYLLDIGVKESTLERLEEKFVVPM